MEGSQRDLFIDKIIDRFIFNNSEITLSPCFNFLPKTGGGLIKTGVRFYCDNQASPTPEEFLKRLCNPLDTSTMCVAYFGLKSQQYRS